MRSISYLSLLLTAIALSACAPNQSIALDKGNADAGATNQSLPSPPEPEKKITVAELMSRVANAAPDSFLYPCTLNAFSDDDRLKLRKLRQTWLSTEQDDRYLLSPSTGCICPGICVLAVADTQEALPKNFALLVIENVPANRYSWLVKNIDLTNAKLIWANSTPIVQFLNLNGTPGKSCLIQWDKKRNSYATTCSDGNGTPLPPLESE